MPPKNLKRQMVINYVPGEECRVAVIEDGTLEEFHSEQADAVSHVGNIYLGKVVNVEPAIQAAFVDFGLDQSGFLHISDLHPRYFPGEDDETTEMVGKKTPRRERPPIQHCLRRGQEIAVQVLKEGVGTKGPTVTSYLSIPGRFLVMMPLMDRVGVSRKVEDEETRRKMREILDQLDLPDGFGFILRTAGMERTKLELKRDLAYLLRLWKDMEKRWKQGSAPRLLYSESDLLVRALRDMLSSEIDRIVVDNEGALRRAARFLKIVAPRSTANLFHYTGPTPVFHAMGIEQQIRNIHSREVPLKSGGRLVIDETEALVAIDVNSGKSREARDAETNAYETNLEAVDEICRQLRLRDLGGIVVNDLIDMRSAKHRREVEARMKENLKKDRARSTVAPISAFGILEMTRQRMRGSQESQHFADCPICRGRGLVQKPDSVADDATRELATLLEYPRVHRVEMVVSPRLAGELLSTKRRTLNRLERVSGKHVDVRVSEAISVDRVTFYAYDDRGADIDTGKLPEPTVDEAQLHPWVDAAAAGEDWAVDLEKEAVAAEPVEEPAPEVEPDLEPMPGGIEDLDQPVPGAPDADDGGKRRRRRRRRRGRGGRGEDGHVPAPNGEGEAPDRRSGGAEGAEHEEESMEPAAAAEPGEGGGESAPAGDGEAPNGEGGKRRRRRRRRRGRGGREQEGADAPAGEGHADEGGGEPVEGAEAFAADGSPRSNGLPHREEPEFQGEEPDAESSEFEAEAHDRHDDREEPAEDGAATAAADDERPVDESAHAENGEAEPGEEPGGERRGRRRRRRRGGRGRNGGGGAGAGGEGGEGSSNGGGRPRQQQQQQPQRSQGQPREQRRESRGGGSPQQPRQPQQPRRAGGQAPAKSTPAAPPPAAATGAGGGGGGAAAKPQPRTLYAFRRKLSPSERFRIKPE